MQSIKILIVDDSFEISKRYGDYLVQPHYEIHYAKNLREAFIDAKIKPPDIILVNEKIQKHTAKEICAELRAEIDTCFSIIILFVTSINDEIKKCASEIGIYKVVEKSITPQDFIEIIESIRFNNLIDNI